MKNLEAYVIYYNLHGTYCFRGSGETDSTGVFERTIFFEENGIGIKDRIKLLGSEIEEELKDNLSGEWGEDYEFLHVINIIKEITYEKIKFNLPIV